MPFEPRHILGDIAHVQVTVSHAELSGYSPVSVMRGRGLTAIRGEGRGRRDRRLRAAGHDVITPDLYDEQTASSLDAALVLMDTVGLEVTCARARRALQVVTGRLAGFSMGNGVIGNVWHQRRTAEARCRAWSSRWPAVTWKLTMLALRASRASSR
jgi:hypothetical protein